MGVEMIERTTVEPRGGDPKGATLQMATGACTDCHNIGRVFLNRHSKPAIKAWRCAGCFDAAVQKGGDDA